MVKFKALIFDAGGVYLQGSFVDFVNKGYRVLGIDKNFRVEKEIVFDVDFNRGKISAEECFRKYFGVPINNVQMQEILRLWKSTWNLQPEIEKFVRRLEEDYILAMLSNSDSVNSQRYLELGWYKPFKVLVLSHEIGILKPDKRIYELTLERLSMRAESCLFIDDQEPNLVPARELGMSVILYKNLNQLIEELTKLELIK